MTFHRISKTRQDFTHCVLIKSFCFVLFSTELLEQVRHEAGFSCGAAQSFEGFFPSVSVLLSSVGPTRTLLHSRTKNNNVVLASLVQSVQSRIRFRLPSLSAVSRWLCVLRAAAFYAVDLKVQNQFWHARIVTYTSREGNIRKWSTGSSQGCVPLQLSPQSGSTFRSVNNVSVMRRWVSVSSRGSGGYSTAPLIFFLYHET